MSGLGSGFVNLFKSWGRGIGKAADNLLLNADARKAISDEVISKYKPRINRFSRSESKRADTIKELDDKLTQSKQALADAQKNWKDKYNNALADAKAQRQTDINNYNTQLKAYQEALANTKAGRQSIFDKLYDSEANYNPSRTMFTDVNTGENYIFNPFNGGYRSLNSLTNKERNKFLKNYENFDNRLFDSKSGDVINAFDKSSKKTYKGNNIFDRYYSNKISTHNADIRDAENQITRAEDDLSNWKNQTQQPQAWDNNVEKQFKIDYKKTNGSLPTGYSVNGQNYKDTAELEKAYKDAVNHLQNRKDYFSRKVSDSISERDAEIAKRIQDAKDIRKAKLALGAGVGAGALYAGAKAMYGGDDTDNGDTPDNIDTTDNTYTGEPDPTIKAENTPDGKDALNGRPLKIDADFNPDEAAAVLASGAYDQGVEDGDSVRSSDDLGNKIGASTRGHTMDDRLYELIKAMQDPYKADAVANYIYSRHGDDPEVQNLGWRGWLNKYYGDSLRSIMNIDPSGYKGMHISGGL